MEMNTADICTEKKYTKEDLYGFRINTQIDPDKLTFANLRELFEIFDERADINNGNYNQFDYANIGKIAFLLYFNTYYKTFGKSRPIPILDDGREFMGFYGLCENDERRSAEDMHFHIDAKMEFEGILKTIDLKTTTYQYYTNISIEREAIVSDSNEFKHTSHYIGFFERDLREGKIIPYVMKREDARNRGVSHYILPKNCENAALINKMYFTELPVMLMDGTFYEKYITEEGKTVYRCLN